MVFPLRYPLKGLIPHTLSEEDKLAAEAILAEALAAKKRADQFGVLSYLKREPVRSKVPNTGFLKNVLSHTVGFNRAQQRKEEESDRRIKDRKRKRSPEPRRSGKRRAEVNLDVEETKSEEDGKIAIGPTRNQFVSRRGRGTFAFSGEGCTIDELFKDEDSIPDLRVPQPLPEEEKEATNDGDMPLSATPKTEDRSEGKRKKQRRKQEKKEKKHKKHKKHKEKKHKKRKKGSD